MNSDEKTVLKISGMDCSSCANSISKKLETRGLTEVNVSFTNGEAIFNNSQHIPLATVVADISSLGYKVVGFNDTDNAWYEKADVLLKICAVFTIPLFLHMFFPHSFLANPWLQLTLCIPVFIIGFYYFGKSAWPSIINRTPNMDVLIILGSTAAFVYSIILLFLHHSSENLGHQLFFETSATIITLVLLGNLIEKKTVLQTTTAIKDLTALQPQVALKIYLHLGEEKVEEIACKDITINSLLLVNTGDNIPADAVVYWGSGLVNESLLTGESEPVIVGISNKVIAGSILIEGTIKIRVEKTGNETALAQIIDLVKEAQRDKPPIQRLGDKISAIFVPAVILISLLTFFISWLLFDVAGTRALLNAIAVLVISCPCAMGLATPTAVMAGLGVATKNGILIKGGGTMEKLAQAQYFIFDKTGTLTTGDFKLNQLNLLNNSTAEEVKSIIFNLSKHSNHPISKSLTKEFQNFDTKLNLHEVQEIKGTGMLAKDLEGNSYQLFSCKAINEQQKLSLKDDLCLTINGKISATLTISDEIKTDAAELISKLKNEGKTVIMLSGDKKLKCETVAATLGIETIYSEQNPHEKLAIIKKYKLLGITAMIGDGINDAPSLVAADVGISMASASQIAINAAEIVLLNNSKIVQVFAAYRYCKATLKTIKQNLFWAFFYNVISIPLAAFGFLNPMIGALSMAMSDVVVIGNSIRLKFKKF